MQKYGFYFYRQNKIRLFLNYFCIYLLHNRMLTIFQAQKMFRMQSAVKGRFSVFIPTCTD